MDENGIPGTMGMPHLKRALHESGSEGDGKKSQLVVPYGRRTGKSGLDGQKLQEEGKELAGELAKWAKEQCGAEVIEVDGTSMYFIKPARKNECMCGREESSFG